MQTRIKDEKLYLGKVEFQPSARTNSSVNDFLVKTPSQRLLLASTTFHKSSASRQNFKESKMPPTLFYGTAIFGTPTIPSLTEAENVSEILDEVRSLGFTELDTAARYPPDNVGGSERLLGATKAGRSFTVNTKVLIAGTTGDGSLTKGAIRASVANSLKTLGVSKIGILYAHAPDNLTPLEEQAEAFHEQYEKGYCERVILILLTNTKILLRTLLSNDFTTDWSIQLHPRHAGKVPLNLRRAQLRQTNRLPRRIQYYKPRR